MLQAGIITFWTAFVGFLMATVVYCYDILEKKDAAALVPRVLTAVAWLLLTASIGLNSVARHGTPLNGPNQLVLLAWALVLVYFLIEYILKFKKYGAALIPVAAVLMFVAQIMTTKGAGLAPVPTALTAQMNNAEVAFHVLLIIFGNAMLLIGCVASALYLYQDHALRTHSNSALSRALPALANIERLSARIISIALPIYFAGQILGITRAIVVDAHLWFADPRIILSGVILAIFAVYLVLYYRQHTSGITTAWIAVAGGIIVLILMVLARTVPVGFHVFGAL
jgi:HemX protein